MTYSFRDMSRLFDGRASPARGGSLVEVGKQMRMERYCKELEAASEH
jgi:hypothetical protein